VVAAALFFVAAGLAHRPVAAAATLVLAVLLVLAVFRRKAAPAAGAIYSAGADRIAANGKRLPGQLSFTPEGLIWSPSSYSVRRGERPVELEAWQDLWLQRGPGIFDVTVTVVPIEGAPLRFGTRRSRRLEELTTAPR
jgi:hypothetical protein